MHMLGQMLQVPDGENRILWGTDSIWGGSPQSQIVRLRRLKIREDLAKKYGYPELTDRVKEKIFGLNAARLLGVDPAQARKALWGDGLEKLKTSYLESPRPSNTQYGWVWDSSGAAQPRLPIGEGDVMV